MPKSVKSETSKNPAQYTKNKIFARITSEKKLANRFVSKENFWSCSLRKKLFEMCTYRKDSIKKKYQLNIFIKICMRDN